MSMSLEDSPWTPVPAQRPSASLCPYSCVALVGWMISARLKEDTDARRNAQGVERTELKDAMKLARMPLLESEKVETAVLMLMRMPVQVQNKTNVERKAHKCSIAGCSTFAVDVRVNIHH
jgi:hypothetical protein